MKTRNSWLLAGLLTIGGLGANGSNAAATIDNSISDAPAATISRIAEINDIQQLGISGESAAPAIARIISANNIDTISIAKSNIANISLIAIANISEASIQDSQIEAAITEIAA